MENCYDSNGLSSFVISELKKVWSDSEFAQTSANVLSVLKDMHEDTADENIWSNEDYVLEAEEHFDWEVKTEGEQVLFKCNDEPELFVELEQNSEPLPDTKITIKIDDILEDDLKCSENGEEVSLKEISYLPPYNTRDVEEDISDLDTAKGVNKIQVINSQNLKRNDVILKSILRSMRRYFCKKFLQLTNFKKTEKQQKVRRENLVRCANHLVEQLDFSVPLKNFPFYYMALAYPSELKKVLNEAKNLYKNQSAVVNQTLSIVKLIENVLNRFSKRIFNSFMEIPEISVLVHHFLSHNTENLERIEGFENWVAILKEKSEQVIANFVQEPKSFTNNPYWIKKTLFIFAKDKKR